MLLTEFKKCFDKYPFPQTSVYIAFIDKAVEVINVITI